MGQKAIYAVVLAAVIAGTNGLMIKYMTSMTPTAIAWLRATIPATLLTIWMLKNKIQFFRGNSKKMLLASGINAARMYFYLIAFTFTSIGNAVIIFYSWPIFVAILGVLFLKEKMTKYQIALLFLAFLGLIIAYSHKTFSFEDRDFIGMLAALLSAIGYAITVIIFKTETNNYDRNEIIFYQNFAGVLVFFPFFFMNAATAEISHLGMGIVYGILTGIVVYNLFFYGLKYLKAGTASSLMYMEVVSSIILGILVLNESFNLTMIIGGSFIVLSSFLLTRSK